MDIKKIAISGAAAALMLSSVVPAFAEGWHHRSRGVTIENKDTTVRNNVTTQANTGLNSIEARWGGEVEDSDIDTGNARARSRVSNDVNYNEVDCGCVGRGGLKIENKDTTVRNNVTTQANTGLNSIEAKGRHAEVENSDIDTGRARAGSVVENFVNTNIVGGGEDS